jgi:hypothetical protein
LWNSLFQNPTQRHKLAPRQSRQNPQKRKRIHFTPEHGGPRCNKRQEREPRLQPGTGTILPCVRIGVCERVCWYPWDITAGGLLGHYCLLPYSCQLGRRLGRKSRWSEILCFSFFGEAVGEIFRANRPNGVGEARWPSLPLPEVYNGLRETDFEN